MNVRGLLLVPAALLVAVLAGCGQGGSGAGTGSGSPRVSMPSTWVCSAPDYIREHAPEGFCLGDATTVADDLSPTGDAR